MSLPNSIKTIEDTEINNITNISIEPTNDIDNNVQLCITNLKILGCIKPKDKLYYIENNFYIDKKKTGQSIKRWFYNGNRKGTISNLETFTALLFNTIDSIYNSECSNDNKSMTNYYHSLDSKPVVFKQENSKLLISFVTEIKNAITGISNLKHTYKKDIATVSSLEVIIEKLSVREKKISEILSVNKC